MPYYILYPKNKTKPVKIVSKRPDPKKEEKEYGFAEGSFKTIKEVKTRLNWMNIPNKKRPEKFRDLNYF